MKVVRAGLTGTVILSFAVSFAEPAPGFIIESPDRPLVWYNPAGEKVSEELHWDDLKQELVLRVGYNTVNYTPTRDQTLFDNVTLAFPTVRRDVATNQLYFVDSSGQKIIIGRIGSGPFGEQIHLAKNIKVYSHRQNGTVKAAISSGEEASR